MKKNKAAKLVLNRETLAELQSPELHQVAGALTERPWQCFSGYNTCGSCRVTCTTNYC